MTPIRRTALIILLGGLLTWSPGVAHENPDTVSPTPQSVLMADLQTLAPGQALLASHHGKKAKMYEGEGEVRIVDLKEKLLVVKHGDIPGFMGAMTMGYPVSSADLLKGLKKGDRIKFKIDAAKEVIIEITPLK